MHYLDTGLSSAVSVHAQPFGTYYANTSVVFSEDFPLGDCWLQYAANWTKKP